MKTTGIQDKQVKLVVFDDLGLLEECELLKLKKRLWNDLLGEMVNDLSKRSRGRVVAQEVVNPDQEVTSQETSSVDQGMSSQNTDNDWEGGAWGEMDG